MDARYDMTYFWLFVVVSAEVVGATSSEGFLVDFKKVVRRQRG